ncbi:MAG: efflux RND transporter periplasmic adaptor subunit [Candidatus Omnitrophota bacterium]
MNLLTGCQPKIEKNKTDEVIPVKVMKIEYKELCQTLDYVGNIKAEDEAVVYPKISGKISEKVKQEGDAVTKGGVIAYIDRDEVGLKFEKAPVESPLTGVVGKVYVDIGVNVSAQTAIALVVNMDSVKIDLDIPEKYLSKVCLGQEANITVDTYSQEEFIGRITKVSPIIDLATRTATVEITIDNPGHRLKSGMFANVRLIIERRPKTPVILKEAIVGKNSYVHIYVIENKKAVLRKISLGIRQGPDYEVTEGLKEGDLVVIMGQQKLYEGAAVNVEMEELSNEVRAE